jgi:preprotein translocase subunit YajC
MYTMPSLPFDHALLFAQDAGAGSFLSPLVLFLPVVLFAYILIIRPQQQQEKKRRAMIDALKKNDKVLTAGGIFGTVVSVDSNNDRIVLRVDDERGVRMAFTKTSVSRVIEASTEKPGEST